MNLCDKIFQAFMSSSNLNEFDLKCALSIGYSFKGKTMPKFIAKHLLEKAIDKLSADNYGLFGRVSFHLSHEEASNIANNLKELMTSTDSVDWIHDDNQFLIDALNSVAHKIQYPNNGFGAQRSLIIDCICETYGIAKVVSKNCKISFIHGLPSRE